MSTAQSERMILAVGVRDDFLHVYHNEQDLLADHTIGTGAGEKTGALEFFDSDGYRLAGEYDHQWHLLRLTRTAEAPNLTLVRQRVQNAFDHIRSYIMSHPETVESYKMTVDEALALCPDLGGPSDFETCLKALAHVGHHHKQDGELGIAHPQNDPWHNLWHGSGWQN